MVKTGVDVKGRLGNFFCLYLRIVVAEFVRVVTATAKQSADRCQRTVLYRCAVECYSVF